MYRWGRDQRKNVRKISDQCECTVSDDNKWTVTCNSIPIEIVVSVFARTTTVDLDQVNLLLTEADTFIPADVLGQKKVAAGIQLVCMAVPMQLNVDINAFRSTKAVTTSMTVSYCDLGFTSALSFLTDFTALTDCTILYASNIFILSKNRFITT